MTGAGGEAEDIVQETFLRAHNSGLADARNPEAYLLTVATRLCIDHLRSARVRREQYVGPWLPEPIATNIGAERAERAWSLSMAFLLLLERLTPVERAVFLLREVFECEFGFIAEATGKSESNCRQLFKRSKDHLQSGQAKFHATVEERTRMLNAFLAACATGEKAALEALLASDVQLLSDGGGKATAALNPIHGTDRVARFLLGVQKKPWLTGAAYEVWSVNGSPAIVTFLGSRLDGVLLLECIDGRVQDVWIMRNPDKLGYLSNAKTAASTASDKHYGE